MEQLQNGFLLEVCPGGFPLSTDSMALADFVRLPPRARVLDLGSGCGTLGLLLCAGDAGCTVTGVELDEASHEAAMRNISRNVLSARLSSICADIRSVSERFPSGHFQAVISNPPYFSGGPVSRSHSTARRDDSCKIQQLFDAAAWALQYGGDFFLVHRPERLAELIAAGSRNRLELKRLRLLRHQAGRPVTLILLQFRKGGKPGLVWEELALHDAQAQPTDDYRRIYHL